MFNRRDPARLRALRGKLLYVAYLAAQAEAVNPDDPYTISRSVLVQTLEHLGELPAGEDLRSALRYLEAKRLVTVRWRRDGSGEFDTYRLEPSGIDLVEETTQDPGVAFPRRRDP